MTSLKKDYGATPAQQALIQLLADGACHSGEDIGRHLGVSRAAIWKQLQKLSVFGLDVLSTKGQGYSLSQSIELLDAKTIFSSLADPVKALVQELSVQFSVGSTSDEVSRRVGAIAEGQALVCLAEFQSSGRGRRGRPWVSPLGHNLSMSFAWQFQSGAAALEGLSLAVGVEVAEALASMGIDAVSLKWPNDILVKNKKLGGILLEMTGDPAGVCQLVIGIGINVHMKDADSKIDQQWTSMILESAKPVSRNKLAADMVARVLPMLATYSEKGFSRYADRWRALDAFANQPVNVIAGSEISQGIARGVNDSGALILEYEGEQRTFYGGEVSLRPGSSHDS